MRLKEVAQTSTAVSARSGRLEKIDRLASLLRRAEPDEVAVVTTWLTGTPTQGRIGVGYATLRDLAAPPAREPSLEVREVDGRLAGISGVSGRGANARRLERLGTLFARADPEEQAFLRRLLTGELRQGALEGVLVEAVARAAEVPAAAVRRAAMLHGALGDVARTALAEGAPGLARYALTLFRPVQPMLAQSAPDAEAGLERLGRARVEYKLDGARVQVHRQGEDVRVFTRRLNDVTTALPEVVEAVRALPVRELVLDGEVLAMTPEGRPRPFQETMRRFGRKLDVARLRRDLPLTPWFFDVLHLDGGTLLDRPTADRIEALGRILPAAARVPSEVVDDPEAAEAVLDAALEAGHEGVMLKGLEAPYEAGRRGAAWLKLKPAHTLDLVVLAAEWGSGRRQGWLSNLHLGARDPAGGFVMLGKTFKGLTDAVLQWQTEALLAREISRDAWTVYVKPELVVEVAFEGLQASPQYPGGLALRFARLKRYRPDKTAAQADTLETVRALKGSDGEARNL